MKKIFTILAATVCAASMFAGSYGILVNGSKYFAGEPAGEFEGFQQYLAHVQVKSGDFCQLCDADNRAVWAVDINTASVQGFTRNGDKYNVTADGCFDFYIKLKYEADELYIGPGSNCGEGIDISGQGGGDDDKPQGAAGHDFYVMGWINGADAGESAYDSFDDKYKFVDGKIMLDCKMGSYIGVKDDQTNYYYFKGDNNATGDNVTLNWANGWSPCQKWAIPEGVNYIIIRKIAFKGDIELQRVDKATFDAYSFDINDDGESAVHNTTVTAKITKTIENGQVVIIKDGIRYNLLGAQLQ